MTVAFLLVFSGCTQTGHIPEKEDTSDAPGVNESAMSMGETEEPDPCEGVDCGEIITACPDGFESACSNPCDPETGECLPCKPDCTGHHITECEPECGTCEIPDEDGCGCVIELFCDGNGRCEPGEYPASGDCPDCDDGDPNTEDSYDFDFQDCVNEPVPFCGDGECGGSENRESCPEDCLEEYPGDVRITALNETSERVELEGYSVDMTGWTLSDDGEKHVYTFPDLFVINGKVRLHWGVGEDNETDLFWQKKSYVWNNDGDTATLRDSNGEVMDTYSY